MAMQDAVAALTPFGFTGLEAEVYAYLLKESPATGYRIAQGIGKPVANTYKAIQTLQAKGAIAVEEGDLRLCRAVPSDELIDRLAREFEQRKVAAKQFLSSLGQPEEDERLYLLRSQLQAMHRSRAMLDEAKSVALLCAPASIVQALADELVRAAGRGVETIVKTNAEVSLPRVEVFASLREDDLLHKGDFLRLIVDGRQHLVGTLSATCTEAVWSRSPQLSLLHHEGLIAEMRLLEVAERLEDGAGPKRLARALTQGVSALQTPGARLLASVTTTGA